MIFGELGVPKGRLFRVDRQHQIPQVGMSEADVHSHAALSLHQQIVAKRLSERISLTDAPLHPAAQVGCLLCRV